MRFVRILRATAAVLAALVAVLTGGVPAGAAGCWPPPVEAPVVDPFRQPACPWCPGNRGLEYDTRHGDAVRAVATGTVTFAGEVAGMTYLVVRLPDGQRVTYGNLAANRFAPGDVVLRGVTVGRAAGRLHLGVRTAGRDGNGGEYVDPAPLMGSWYRRPRLIPVTADQPAPAPPPLLRCRPPAGAGGDRSPMTQAPTTMPHRRR
jgi:murein DD-endopeptidase MepM/ murein hydrolase activator NlpD